MKTFGNPMKTYGQPMENLWKYDENTQKTLYTFATVLLFVGGGGNNMTGLLFFCLYLMYRQKSKYVG